MRRCLHVNATSSAVRTGIICRPQQQSSTRRSTRLQAYASKGTDGNSLSASLSLTSVGRSLMVGSQRSRVPAPKASSGSASGNGLSLSRDGNGLSVGSSRGGPGGGSGGGGNTGEGKTGGGPSGDDAHPMRLWTYIFAAALAAGGAAAYFRKGSVKSLGASASASFILFLCAKAMMGPSAAGAARVAFGLTLLLGISMVNRFSQTKKVMPAGLVAGSSLCMSMGYLLAGL